MDNTTPPPTRSIFDTTNPHANPMDTLLLETVRKERRAANPPPESMAPTVENYVAATKAYHTATMRKEEPSRRRLGMGRTQWLPGTGDPVADQARREHDLHDGAQAIAEFVDNLKAKGGGTFADYSKLYTVSIDLAHLALSLADSKLNNH